MTKASTSKAVVTVVPADINAVNETYASQFADFIKKGLSTETKIWESMVADHLKGLISVRGMKETIAKVNAEAGALPSVAVTGAQYFASTVKVRNLEGGENVPLKDSIGVATQGERKFGKKEFQDIIANCSDFATLAETVEKQPAKPKNGGGSDSSSVEIADLDGALALVIGYINEADEELLLIRKIADAESLVSTLQFFIRNAKAYEAAQSEMDAAIERHPAKGKAKAKAKA